MRRTEALLTIAIFCLAACNKPPARATSRERSVPPGEVGSRLPEFSLKTLDGREVASSQLRGKVVLIDYWATWCAPCKQEMPGYQKLADRYGPRGLAVVGMKFDAMADTIDPLKFAKSIGVRYPLAVPNDDLNLKFGGIEGLPTTMIYDRNGVLRKKIIGFEYTAVVEAALTALL